MLIRNWVLLLISSYFVLILTVFIFRFNINFHHKLLVAKPDTATQMQVMGHYEI